MENSKKPSVFFVQSHHHFADIGTPFTADMLSWRFYRSEDDEVTDESTISAYRNAFSGFDAIPNFVIKISIRVDVEKKRFYFAKRTWGDIYLNDEVVLSFSHSRKDGHYAFYSLFDWPESKIKGGGDKITWEHIPDETIYTWNVATWTLFFKTRIIWQSEMLDAKAINKRKDAGEFEKASKAILDALS